MGFKFSFHSSHSDTLFNIADSFSLEISKLTKNLSTRFSGNYQDSNFILNLVFLQPFSLEFNNHCIHSDWRLSSDHTPITIDVSISNKESLFLEDLTQSIKNLNTLSI